MGRRKKSPGHYCWVCGRQRPNERFSGKGHARHVCRECARLGGKELAYRQTVRNLQRCVSWEGFIRRKQRAAFQRFLQHEDPRIRALAEAMQREDEKNRRRPADEESAEDAAPLHDSDDDCPF